MEEGELIVNSFLVNNVQQPTSSTADSGPRVQKPEPSPKGASFTHMVLNIEQTDFKSICGGVISSGKNEYFCFKPTNMCNVKSHSTKHKAFKPNRVFLVGTSFSQNGQLTQMRAIKPSVCHYDTTGLNTEEVSVIVNETNKLIQEEDTETSAIMEFEEAISKFNILAKQQVLLEATKTTENVSTTEVPDFASEIELEDVKPSSSATFSDRKDQEINNLRHEFNKLETFVKQDIEDVASAAVERALMEEIDELKQDILLSVRISPELNSLQRDVARIKRDQEDGCKFTPSDPCLCCEPLRKEVATLKQDKERLLGGLSTLNNTLGSLERRIASLESGNGTTADDGRNVNDVISDLMYKITLMEARIGSEVLQFGSIMLESLGDTGVFVNDHVPSCSFGCFFDLVALMDAPRDTNIDEETFVKALANADKAKFASVMEVSTSASFLHITPICFCKAGRQDLSAIHGSVDKMLHLVKDRIMWCHQGGMLGLKRDLQREITEQVHAIQSEIRFSLKDSQGADLAREFLVASQNCFNDFVNWTEDFFHELQSMSACSEEEAWQLILECWLAFFIDLRSIRMECASISLAGLEPNSTRRKEVVARFIWTMGRTIKLQDEYREKQFRNHPTIASVINYHLFQHRVPTSTFKTSMNKVTDDIKSLHTWKGQVNRDIKALQAKK